MRTANLAIVFTDIKGFTERTGQQSYEDNQRMLRAHEALLLPVFRAFEGRVIKTIGDAFLVVFASPTKAVLSGVAIQDRLWQFNQQVPEEQQIRVRVAVNLGEVREEKGDIYGEPVNIAARVEGLAEAGEVMFTEAVFLSMNKAEVPAEDRGVHELKGISHPVRVYRVPPGAYALEAKGSSEGSLPYGGLGLSRAGRLPPVDPESINRGDGGAISRGTSELVDKASDLQKAMAPRLRAAGSGALATAGVVGRGLWGQGRAAIEQAWTAFRALDPTRQQLIAAGALALIFFLWIFDRGDAIERAVDRGDLAAARALLHELPRGPARSFDEGRIDEAQGSWRSAAGEYVDAARGGDRRGFKRLLKLTSSDVCAARAAAAQALGELGDTGARGRLESLASASFADEGEDDALHAIFGCSSKRAARNALEALSGK